MTPAVVDPAFKTAGRRPGMEIWRIEKLKVVPVPLEQYGYFYDGDCYIVMVSIGTPPRAWKIHFWIGDRSTPDEQCAVAYKSVELDDSLGGIPIQYREIQNHESKQFLSYFKGGVRYMVGGVDTALRSVDPNSFKKRLFHVKGKRNCRVQQVELTVQSLNQGDVFILDAGRIIFVWNGPQSNVGERIKGAEIARQIRDEERGGKAKIELIDDKWANHGEFFKELGANPGAKIASSNAADDDRSYEKRANDQLNLFRVSDASGKIQVTKVQPPLSKNSLDTNADCFILDMGSSGVYAWVGKACTPQEKREVWTRATEYLKQSKLPHWTQVIKVNEGQEPPIFKVAMNWPGEVLKETVLQSRVAHIDLNAHKVDVRGLHNVHNKVSDHMPDDGKGSVMVWRVENFALKEIPRGDYGTFYSGDSYVVFYKSGKISGGIVYFWLGSSSSSDEKASAAMFAAQIDEKETNGRAIQIRVVQGKEPRHFIAIFGGSLVSFTGGKASGFKSRNDRDTYDTDGTRLFQVRNNRIMQVPEKASALNSNDMFVLETPKQSYIWMGKGANSLEKNIAVGFAQKLHLKNINEIHEGQEPAEFWSHLGGKGTYATGGNLLKSQLEFTARLFQCSNARGYFHVEEIVDFSQEDLVEDDVMLLDTYHEVYVWIGRGANNTEKKEALKTAIDYVRTDPSGRTLDETTMLTVKQGSEPPSFTGHFPGWVATFWQDRLSYEQLKQQLQGEKNASVMAGPAVQPIAQAIGKYNQTYPLDVLQKPTNQLPDGVDAAHKERHLNDNDFQSLFNVSKDAFQALPAWKQTETKKKAGLY